MVIIAFSYILVSTVFLLLTVLFNMKIKYRLLLVFSLTYIVCKKIAVTNQELYYYFNNPQSISRSAFKEKDEDYVEQWCIVAEQSHALFPKLDKVLKHRLIFAHFRLLNKIALTVNNSFREFEKNIFNISGKI